MQTHSFLKSSLVLLAFAACTATVPDLEDNDSAALSTVTYDAVKNLSHSGGLADWRSAGGWNLNTNGYLSTSNASPGNPTFAAGSTTLTVRAFSDLSQGVGGHLVVSVGGTTVGSAYVNGTSPSNYTFSFTATAGAKEVRLTFDNDSGAGGQDRNLIVQSLTVSTAASSCTGTTFNAVSNMTHSGGLADWRSAGGWNLNSNGYVSTANASPGNPTFSAGSTTLTVRAFSDLSQGVGGHLVLSVGGVTVGSTYVNTTTATNYPFTFTTTAGAKEVRVTFDNDSGAGGQDRNLIVISVTTRCSGSGGGQTPDAGTPPHDAGTPAHDAGTPPPPQDAGTPPPPHDAGTPSVCTNGTTRCGTTTELDVCTNGQWVASQNCGSSGGTCGVVSGTAQCQAPSSNGTNIALMPDFWDSEWLSWNDGYDKYPTTWQGYSNCLEVAPDANFIQGQRASGWTGENEINGLVCDSGATTCNRSSRGTRVSVRPGSHITYSAWVWVTPSTVGASYGGGFQFFMDVYGANGRIKELQGTNGGDGVGRLNAPFGSTGWVHLQMDFTMASTYPADGALGYPAGTKVTPTGIIPILQLNNWDPTKGYSEQAVAYVRDTELYVQ